MSVFFRTSPKHKLKIIKVSCEGAGPALLVLWGTAQGSRGGSARQDGAGPELEGASAILKPGFLPWVQGSCISGCLFPASAEGRNDGEPFTFYTKIREWGLGDAKGTIKRLAALVGRVVSGIFLLTPALGRKGCCSHCADGETEIEKFKACPLPRVSQR